MEIKRVLEILDEYYNELGVILDRFTEDHQGLHIDLQDGCRLGELVTELFDFISDHIPNSEHHSKNIADSYYYGKRNWLQSSSYGSVEEIRGVVKSLKVRIERNPSLCECIKDEITIGSEDKKGFDGLEIITNRFHVVAMQLRQRHSNRNTIAVNDEYDVQDIFRSLLYLYFIDIRIEEWVPSYAGSASRCDFLLPEINTIIEVKKNKTVTAHKGIGRTVARRYR